MLERELEPGRVGVGERHQRDAAHVLDGRADADDVHHPGHHSHRHAEVVGALRKCRELLVGHRGVRNDQFLCFGLHDGALEVIGGAQVWNAFSLDVGRSCVVDDADRAQSVIGHLSHPGDDLVGDRSGADDDRGLAETEPAAQVALRQGSSEANPGNQDGGVHPDVHHDVAGADVLGNDGARRPRRHGVHDDRQRQQGSDGDRGLDRFELVEEAIAQFALVQPSAGHQYDQERDEQPRVGQDAQRIVTVERPVREHHRPEPRPHIQRHGQRNVAAFIAQIVGDALPQGRRGKREGRSGGAQMRGGRTGARRVYRSRRIQLHEWPPGNTSRSQL